MKWDWRCYCSSRMLLGTSGSCCWASPGLTSTSLRFSSPATSFPSYWMTPGPSPDRRSDGVSVFGISGVDGWAARRLNQTSEFGAWLDVVVDNLGRGMLWSMLFEAGWLVAAVEWCVFVCTHSALGAQWKSRLGAGPPWVQAVMANGFKTPPGVLAIGGLHVLPVWLYGYQRGVLTEPLSIPAWLQGLGAIVLIAGRLLCFTVEVWCIWMHIRFLTRDEKAAKEEE